VLQRHWRGVLCWHAVELHGGAPTIAVRPSGARSQAADLVRNASRCAHEVEEAASCRLVRRGSWVPASWWHTAVRRPFRRPASRGTRLETIKQTPSPHSGVAFSRSPSSTSRLIAASALRRAGILSTMSSKERATRTASFGVNRRESHDSSPYYRRSLAPVTETKDLDVSQPLLLDEILAKSAEIMDEVADNSVALMVTSPPYHVGKDYESDATFDEFLEMLGTVLAETYRKLQPGGRAIVNVANLGRRPYIPLSRLVTGRMLAIGYLMRAEIIWRKARGAGGNCAWGSWRSPANPVVRDVHEYCLWFSKGRFDRVVKGHATISAEGFMEATLSVWEMPPERASRVKHPAPFPVELPRRFIQLYTYQGELILDPFMGSGSTAVAAVETNRHWIGYEIDPVYCDLTRQRGAEALTRRGTTETRIS
jgi:DNA modification methylase